MYELAKKIRPIIGNIKIAQRIEKKIIEKDSSYNLPPIFIIGLPRSGSTLLYQLICNYFYVGYFSNICSLFYGSPVTIMALTKRFHKNLNIKEFISHYGTTKGLFSPSEAGGIYRSWFNETKKITYNQRRKSINKITNMFERPFVWKNLNLSKQVEKLNTIFPDALFIKMERKLEFICQSIYLRIQSHENINIEEFEQIKYTEERNKLNRIINTIIKFDQNLNRDISRLNLNFIAISYEIMCNNPNHVLNQIEQAYLKKGHPLYRRSQEHIEKFLPAERIKLNNIEWRQIKSQLSHSSTIR